MAKGNSQYATWRCPDCRKPARLNSYYNRKGEGEKLTAISKFCKQCREHKVFKAKDTKKGN